MEYELIKSKRKTFSVEIRPDGSICVKAPMLMSKSAIDKILLSKEEWILKQQKKMQKKASEFDTIEKLTDDELKELKKKAKKIILPLVEDYSEIMGVIYGRVAFRTQKTRWGSCSREGNLNFNCLLALCPEPVIRYVVVHELSHRVHMNHSKAFWLTVEEYMPDYKEHRKWLKQNGEFLIKRLN
ncbi:MAG: M48 family metallopeptidase [Lachnospiraceae bacterium]|nr:M48 family metallopeptidase [Lachnospiraceae bacterium]